jgi:hypothetical protein
LEKNQINMWETANESFGKALLPWLRTYIPRRKPHDIFCLETELTDPACFLPSDEDIVPPKKPISGGEDPKDTTENQPTKVTRRRKKAEEATLKLPETTNFQPKSTAEKRRIIADTMSRCKPKVTETSPTEGA